MRVKTVGQAVEKSRGRAPGAAPQGCVAGWDGRAMGVMGTWATVISIPALEVLLQPPRLQRPPQQVKYGNGQT